MCRSGKLKVVDEGVAAVEEFDDFLLFTERILEGGDEGRFLPAAIDAYQAWVNDSEFVDSEAEFGWEIYEVLLFGMMGHYRLCIRRHRCVVL